ncbi:MAG: SDR family oxidoreductase [Chloroflexi bacterium]|nr:SDR family oxidoreductase [Chloroflexota bacterium]
MSQESFNGRLALITGGSSGIGLALAKALVQEGARVWLVARRKNVLEEVFHSSPFSSNHSAGIFSADVSDFRQAQAAVDDVISKAGVPDLLINSAGVTHPGYVQEIPLEIFRQLMDINYFGTVHMVKALLPRMIERGSGHIVNISSAAGFLGVFGYSAYGATKYAVRGFSDVLRAEVKPLGIRVSIVFPPDTDTPQLAYENQFKPFETREISGTAGVLSADQVAKTILNGVRRGKYVITPGTETSVLYRLSGLLGNAVYPIMDGMVAQARRKKPSS